MIESCYLFIDYLGVVVVPEAHEVAHGGGDGGGVGVQALGEGPIYYCRGVVVGVW